MQMAKHNTIYRRINPGFCSANITAGPIYGLVLGTGAGLVRETAGLVLGHYFRKRREFVEMVVQAGTGVGIALFSVFYREAVGVKIRRGLIDRAGRKLNRCGGLRRVEEHLMVDLTQKERGE
ncbi:hypothetical protein HZH68_015835 [Vespula germanica]|uniref:Uncharacterized protein n=1 Tax=Vespula germanica TaxID=30212 RepID=A0A834MQU2_VESGE|nr:hypothetical protein HZH68_015835 [Vespula germanica]